MGNFLESQASNLLHDFLRTLPLFSFKGHKGLLGLKNLFVSHVINSVLVEVRRKMSIFLHYINLLIEVSEQHHQKGRSIAAWRLFQFDRNSGLAPFSVKGLVSCSSHTTSFGDVVFQNTKIRGAKVLVTGLVQKSTKVSRKRQV